MKTKLEMAVEYLSEKGRASTGEMNKALGLPYGDSAVSYLMGALDRGDIVRKGRIWSLPDRQPAGPTAGEIIIGRAMRPGCGVAA